MLLDLEKLVVINKAIEDGKSEEYKNNPLASAWGRIGKIGEEYGELMEALIGATGQNFRKGYNKTWNDVYKELADVVFTAILAMVYLSDDAELTEEYLHRHLMKLYLRIPGEYKE